MDIAALATAHPDHWRRAAPIRTLALDAVAAASSGHSGMPMGMADIATVLFEKAPALRRGRPRLARPRPVHPVQWPWLHAALCAALSDRLAGHDAGADQELPSAWLEHRGPSGIRARQGDRDHHRPAGPGAGQCRGLRHRRGIPARQVGPEDHRSPHMGLRRRRLPDGRRQPRGDRACRPAGTEPPDRDLGQQRHHHRRQGRPRRPHRPDGAFRGRGLGRVRLRRPRPRGYRPRPDRGQGLTAPGDDRLQDAYRARSRRAGHRQGPWRADRCRAACSHEGGLWLAPWRIRGARRHQGRVGGHRRPRPGGPRGVGDALRAPVRRQAGGVRARLRRRKPQAALGHDPRAEETDLHQPSQGRHPQGVGNGARGHQPDPARDDWRVGRPDGLEQHPDRGSGDLRAGEPQGPLHPFRHPRTRDGGGDERHGAPWRRAALWRHLLVFRRLRATLDAAFGTDGRAGAIRDDA